MNMKHECMQRYRVATNGTEMRPMSKQRVHGMLVVELGGEVLRGIMKLVPMRGCDEADRYRI